MDQLLGRYSQQPWQLRQWFTGIWKFTYRSLRELPWISELYHPVTNYDHGSCLSKFAIIRVFTINWRDVFNLLLSLLSAYMYITWWRRNITFIKRFWLLGIESGTRFSSVWLMGDCCCWLVIWTLSFWLLFAVFSSLVMIWSAFLSSSSVVFLACFSLSEAMLTTCRFLEKGLI